MQGTGTEVTESFGGHRVAAPGLDWARMGELWREIEPVEWTAERSARILDNVLRVLARERRRRVVTGLAIALGATAAACLLAWRSVFR